MIDDWHHILTIKRPSFKEDGMGYEYIIAVNYGRGWKIKVNEQGEPILYGENKMQDELRSAQRRGIDARALNWTQCIEYSDLS